MAGRRARRAAPTVGWALSAVKSGWGQLARLARAQAASPAPPPLSLVPRPLTGPRAVPGTMSEWVSYYRSEGPEDEEDEQEEGTEAVGKGLPPLPPSQGAARGPLPSGVGGGRGPLLKLFPLIL